jgi:hypothetical protein
MQGLCPPILTGPCPYDNTRIYWSPLNDGTSREGDQDDDQSSQAQSSFGSPDNRSNTDWEEDELETLLEAHAEDILNQIIQDLQARDNLCTAPTPLNDDNDVPKDCDGQQIELPDDIMSPRMLRLLSDFWAPN